MHKNTLRTLAGGLACMMGLVGWAGLRWAGWGCGWGCWAVRTFGFPPRVVLLLRLLLRQLLLLPP